MILLHTFLHLNRVDVLEDARGIRNLESKILDGEGRALPIWEQARKHRGVQVFKEKGCNGSRYHPTMGKMHCEASPLQLVHLLLDSDRWADSDGQGLILLGTWKERGSFIFHHMDSCPSFDEPYLAQC